MKNDSSEHFQKRSFLQFLSDEVETIFYESKAKGSKLFKSKLNHRKLLRKWFWSSLEIKNECSDHLKRAYFIFLQISEWWSWTHFRESEAKRSKLFKLKFRHRNVLKKLLRSFLEFHKQYCVRVNVAFFRFLQISYWGRWNHFLAKWGKEFKIISIKVWS